MLSNICNYSDAYVLVTENMKVAALDTDNNFAFKNCAPFTWCVTHINDEHIDNAENLDIIMPMYNLIEYSDNYTDTSGSLWHFKRDKSPTNNNKNHINVATNNHHLNTSQVFWEK